MNDPTITLSANLTADPELRYTPTGKPVTLLRLASTPRRRHDAGQWVDGTTTYLDAEIWGPPAENASESLVKGSRVLLTGRIRTDAWTPTERPLAGIEQRRIRIAVDELAASIRYAVARSVRPERTTGPQTVFGRPMPSRRSSPRTGAHPRSCCARGQVNGSRALSPTVFR